MARVGAPYLPIRPAGHKPAPVPYFHELMKAQNMLPVGITALAASAGNDDKKKKPAGVGISTPAIPPPDEDPTVTPHAKLRLVDIVIIWKSSSSPSLADNGRESSPPSLKDTSDNRANTGASLTSVTVTVTVAASVRLPSDTVKVNVSNPLK